jgi:hypothetical protein
MTEAYIRSPLILRSTRKVVRDDSDTKYSKRNNTKKKAATTTNVEKLIKSEEINEVGTERVETERVEIEVREKEGGGEKEFIEIHEDRSEVEEQNVIDVEDLIEQMNKASLHGTSKEV